ncbi:hypothetical protein THRCLA_05682 [Thraustotheca clavata]|uniref:Uncharacterized protein n=1 Tax=Thraustotheca clavata TaxID=74557 RepID=A0A1V9ZV76_9STRA|nr:hypothetical protein THRCLA_05682 [Thraustotheca clavata]
MELQVYLDELGCPVELLQASPLQIHSSKRDLLIWLYQLSRNYLQQTVAMPNSTGEMNMLLTRWLLQMGVESEDICMRLIDGTLNVVKTNQYLLKITELLYGFLMLEKEGTENCIGRASKLLKTICANEKAFFEDSIPYLFPPAMQVHTKLKVSSEELNQRYKFLSQEFDRAIQEHDKLLSQYPDYCKNALKQNPPELGRHLSVLHEQLERFGMQYRQEVQVWLNNDKMPASSRLGTGELISTRTTTILQKYFDFINHLEAVLTQTVQPNQEKSQVPVALEKEVANLSEEIEVIEALILQTKRGII